MASIIDERPIAIRFTAAQKAWLRNEAKRLDRPIGWVVRDCIEAAMKKRPRTDQIDHAS